VRRIQSGAIAASEVDERAIDCCLILVLVVSSDLVILHHDVLLYYLGLVSIMSWLSSIS